MSWCIGKEVTTGTIHVALPHTLARPMRILRASSSVTTTLPTNTEVQPQQPFTFRPRKSPDIRRVTRHTNT